MYVCTGKYAKKYHFTKTCDGLDNCKGDIVKTTEYAAREAGRGLCGYED